MEDIQLNYIFINPFEPSEDLTLNKTFNTIKKIHSSYYDELSDIVIKYWSYNDITLLLEQFDHDLYDLYLKINPLYAALLSDIGRFIVLYNFGGVYHDLKFIAKPKFFKYLVNVKDQYNIIGEQHPQQKSRVRSGNIISFVDKDPFFLSVLNSIKVQLLIAQDKKASGSERMFAIGSGVYIDLFAKNINLRKDMFMQRFDWRYLKYHKSIYKANITKWQNIEEQIIL